MGETATNQVGEVGGLFAPLGDLRGGLAGRAVRGGRWLMGGQVVVRGLALGVLMVTARVVPVEGFGVMALLWAVTAVLWLGYDLGLGLATVRQEHVTPKGVSTAWWLNAGAGLVCGGLVAGLGPVLAGLGAGAEQDRGELWGLAAVMGLGPVLAGLGVQHDALLRRAMRFRELAWVNVAAAGAAGVVGVGLALLGLGVWSLAWMEVVRHGARTLGWWLASGWRPGWPGRLGEVRKELRFGAHMVGVGLANCVGHNADDALVGWWCGAGPLALYSKAYGLLMMGIREINVPLLGIAVPTLSRLAREPEAFERYYCKALGLVSAVTMPLAVGMMVMAEDVVGVVLGPAWLGAARIFVVFGAAAVVRGAWNTTGWLFVATGRSREMLRWTMGTTAVMVLCFAVGVRWGAMGVAGSYVVGQYALLVPGVWLAARGTGVRVSSIGGALWRPMAAAVAMGLVLWAMAPAWGGWQGWARLAGAVVVGVGVYGAVLTVLSGGVRGVREFGRLALRN